MKNIFFGLLILPLFCDAQYIAMSNNTVEIRTEWYVQNSPTNTPGNRRNIILVKDSTYWINLSNSVGFTALSNTNNAGTPTGLIWSDNLGNLRHSPISSLSIAYSQLTGTPTIPVQVNLTNGTGISITGTYPNLTITNTGLTTTPTFTSGNGISVTGTYPSFTISRSKRQETYSGTTDANGLYTITFGAAYAAAPNIQASITNQSGTNQFIRVSSVSTTGATINVYQRNSVTLLGIEVLLAATANVSGATVDVLVTEK